VWEFGKGRHRRRLTLKKSLFGHSEAVTCLTASPAYNIIVSGSRDRTCIIWDLNELVFVRQLRGHAAPVAAVAINELTVSNLIYLSIAIYSTLFVELHQTKKQEPEADRGQFELTDSRRQYTMNIDLTLQWPI